MRTLFVIGLLLCSSAGSASAQIFKSEHFVNLERPIAAAIQASTFDEAAPERTDRIEQALIMTSFGASMAALGVTTGCTAEATCRERNPVMRTLLGRGTARAIVVKSAVSTGVHYTLWRAPKSRWRTAAIIGVTALNLADAINNVVVMKRIEDGRSR